MPTLPEALALAIERHRAGDLQTAEGIYRQILAVDPWQPEAHQYLGVIAIQVGKFDLAVESLRRSLESNPDYVDALANLGYALTELGKLDDAVAALRRALELRPDFTEAHLNLGNALTARGDLDDAVAHLRRAIALRPDFVESHGTLAYALIEQGRYDEAIACCHRALDLDPNFAEAHYNLGLCRLLHGDFEHGWPEYEWRWRTSQYVRPSFSQPPWDGSPLDGRTILLLSEQGLGDALQFVRYAPLVQQRGGRVLVQCQPSLVRLLSSCAGIDELIPKGQPLPPFSTYAPLLSLPPLLGTTSPAEIPSRIPYLQPNPDLVARWRSQLEDVPGFRVGIVWQGNPKHRRDRWRSVAPDRFAPLADVPGVSLVSLQTGDVRDQRQQFPRLAINLTDELTDIADTAAVIRCMDLVVSVDTAVVHLAGALGAPVWAALPFAPDWRWMLHRTDSPWYPSLRLFRQPRLGDWDDVFERMHTALRETTRRA